MTPQNPSSQASRTVALGTALTVTAAVGFSAKAVLAKLIYAQAPIAPITLMALRMALSLPFFLAVALHASRAGAAHPLTVRQRLMVAAIGVVGYYVASLFDFMGLRYVSAGLERLVLYLYPTLVLIASAALERRGIARGEMLALLLSYAGIALVVAEDVAIEEQMALGAALVFVSAVAFAVFMIGAGRLIPQVGSARFTAYAMTAACTATLTHFAAVATPSVFDLPLAAYALIAAMAMFSTVAPVFLMSAAVRRLGAERASMLGFIGPVLTLAFGYALLDESPSAMQLLGTVFVLGGVAAIGTARRR